jgi:NTE family protein
VALSLAGCASWSTLGTPLSRVDPQQGYRLRAAVTPHRGDELLVVASFSGGGMRAAALAHGVLAELARTAYGSAPATRVLLDELDVISGVSGGAVTAAYFALHREHYFEEFEPRFLQRNVAREMWQSLLNPATVVRLMSRRFGRGDLYAEVLDRRLFQGATYASLAQVPGAPFVILNATDLSVGARFEFTQDRFDAICVDLSRYPLARAVAASAASPPAVSPLALRNFAGQCGYQLPAWAIAAAREGDDADSDATRRRLLAREQMAYQQAARYPYLHLVDGSIADDLGVRALTDLMLGPTTGTSWRTPGMRPRKIVLIAVNATADTGPGIARRRAAPSELETARRAAQVSLDRYSMESTLLLRSMLEELARRRDATAPQLYLVEVDPRRLTDAAQRDAIMSTATTLALPRAVTARLVAAGAQLLAESPEFQRLLRDLRNAP